MRPGVRPRPAVLLAVVAVGALSLGGCHGAALARPGSPDPPAAAATGAADPLGSIESSLDRIEHDVDSDGAG